MLGQLPQSRGHTCSEDYDFQRINRHGLTLLTTHRRSLYRPGQSLFVNILHPQPLSYVNLRNPKGEDSLEDINSRKAGLLLRTHLFLKRTFFFYRPWDVYWALYFGPWTWLFRGLSWLVPKQDNLFIFGSNEGKHYSDNSRSLFEYIQANDNSIRAVWFTNSKDVYNEVEKKHPGKVVMSPSLRASFLYLRAGQAIISFGYQDLCKMPWIPSIKINQLWHGVPLKKIGFLGRKIKLRGLWPELRFFAVVWEG